MGRLYQKTPGGTVSLAYFENGRVRGAKYALGTEVSYSGGYIYQNRLDGQQSIATCDSNGNIYKGNGAYGPVLAKCVDGQIYEGGSTWNTVLAWYEGDMYGAAAAAAVTLLRLGEESNASSGGASPGSNKAEQLALWLSWFFREIFVFLLPFYPVLIVGPLMIIGMVSVIIYIPSLIVMNRLKRNNRLTKKNMRNAALLWIVCGPFAWLYLRHVMKRG